MYKMYRNQFLIYRDIIIQEVQQSRETTTVAIHVIVARLLSIFIVGVSIFNFLS